MDHFTALGMRRELLSRLVEALASTDDLAALVHFLRDDLAYAPDNGSIIGAVLRDREFDAWKDLMTGVQWNAAWPIDYETAEIRELSQKLLIQMEHH